MGMNLQIENSMKNNQWLHAYKVEFNGLEELEYLNGKVFTSDVDGRIRDIEIDLFE